KYNLYKNIHYIPHFLPYTICKKADAICNVATFCALRGEKAWRKDAKFSAPFLARERIIT
ncbi:MAG: hypothetical protein IJK94_07920, partial [Bacteroidaceae bacterium]|nr:hypothetical protein [Bacteroidaceae bacterium]